MPYRRRPPAWGKPVLAGMAGLFGLLSYLLARRYAPLVLSIIVVSGMILVVYGERSFRKDWQVTAARVCALSSGWILFIFSIIWTIQDWPMIIAAWCIVFVAGLLLWAEGKNRIRYASHQSWRGFRRPKPSDLMREGLWITVKYPGRCLKCSAAITPGERALWKKGVGIWHEICP